MDFDLTAEQASFRESVRAFVKRECGPDVVRRVVASGRHDEAVWRKLADAGLLGVAIAAEHGGMGGDTVDMCLALEALAPYTAVTGPYFTSICFGGKTISAFGSDEQKRKLLPELCAGRLRFALSITEPGGGTDVLGALRTRARRDPAGGWILDGAKSFTSQAELADYLVVVARTAEGARPADGVSVFLVPRGAPGVTLHEIDTILEGARTYQVFYENVRVDDGALLGEEGRGFYHLLATLNNERVGIAAMCVGLGHAALDEAVAYAREREAFGKPIAAFQALQHFAAESATELELARLCTLRAAWVESRGRARGVEATMAKMAAADAAVRAADRAMQICGGMGLTNDMNLLRYWRSARVFQVGPITQEQCKNLIAEKLLGMPRSY
jgi:alkylation response protein AidB-like acyl-CoA dehydrogenase